MVALLRQVPVPLVQELLKRITFHSKSLVFKTVSVPAIHYLLSKERVLSS